MSAKSYYKMIELHSDKFIDTMKNDKKFSPYLSIYSKSLLQCAVMHDNFEAFVAMVNHPKFKDYTTRTYLYNISERIAESDWERNKRYFDALMSVDYNFTINDLSYFKTNYDIFMEALEKINNLDYKALLKNIPYYNDSIKVHLLEKIIKYHQDNGLQLIAYDFQNLILEEIRQGSITCIEIISKNGYDISTVNLKPLVCHIFDKYYSNQKNKESLINYLLEKNWKYNSNLFDYIEKPKIHYNGFSYTLSLLAIKKNHSKFKEQFTAIKDTGNAYFNNFVIDVLFMFTSYYLNQIPSKDLEKYWTNIYFLIQIANENNVTNMIETLPHKFYEQASELYNFPNLSNVANKKVISAYHITYLKQIMKEFMSIMIASKQTQTEDFKNLMKKVFTIVELQDLSPLIEKYKDDFTEKPTKKVKVTKKKVTKPKVNEMDI